MKLTYENLAACPRIFLSFTGITPAEFLVLLMDFDYAWQIYEVEQLIGSFPRQRQPGGGRKVTGLPHIEDKLLFILIYFKLYPLQAVLGFLFGMSQSQANVWIHTLSDILKSALSYGTTCLPERDGGQLAGALAKTEELLALIDGVERRKQRPTDAAAQKADYSGKKKGHTRKNVIVTTYNRRRVEYLSDTDEGRRHDKPIADKAGLTFPDDISLAQDTGFEGYAPPNVRVCQPKKKPKGKELSPDEKARNTLIARLRIRVEHVIAGVKRCRIVKDIFRNTKQGFDDLVMEIACGLHNFRGECRHWGSP